MGGESGGVREGMGGGSGGIREGSQKGGVRIGLRGRRERRCSKRVKRQR